MVPSNGCKIYRHIKGGSHARSHGQGTKLLRTWNTAANCGKHIIERWSYHSHVNQVHSHYDQNIDPHVITIVAFTRRGIHVAS